MTKLFITFFTALLLSSYTLANTFDEALSLRIKEAYNTRTNPDRLRELPQDQEVSVCASLAKNRRAPAEII